jgi:transposase InsO family protein
MDRVTDEDTRDRTEQGALRVSQDPRAAEPPRLGCWEASGASALQGRRPSLEKRPQRKRKAVRHREERFTATAPNRAWSIDFVADQLQDGTRFQALTILDVCTREGVAIEAGQSLRGEDVVRVLNRVKQERGVPKFLFCDNGSGVHKSSHGPMGYQNGMKIDSSRPGKPTDNAFVESGPITTQLVALH